MIVARGFGLALLSQVGMLKVYSRHQLRAQSVAVMSGQAGIATLRSSVFKNLSFV